MTRDDDRKGGRGGRGGGRGGRRPLSREEQVSKAMSRLLRHQAVQEGLEVRAGGWVKVDEFLASRTIKSLKVSFPELLSLIDSSDKQRFAIKPLAPLPNTPSSSTATSTNFPISEIDATSDPSTYLIRATQGHSIALPPADPNSSATASGDIDDLLTPLTPSSIPPIVVHGTTQAAWPLIVASGGLKPMGRNHVHFATGLPKGFKETKDTPNPSTPQSQGSNTAPEHSDSATSESNPADLSLLENAETISTSTSIAKSSSDAGTLQPPSAAAAAPTVSGMRSSSTILIYLDVSRAMSAGQIAFGISSNGVVLTPGIQSESETQDQGTFLVPLRYFRKVEDRKRGVILMRDGILTAEGEGSLGASSKRVMPRR